MPRRTMVCEKVFQEEGVFADVNLAEYPLDFIPFDSDILSLELDGAYKACSAQLQACCTLHTARSEHYPPMCMVHRFANIECQQILHHHLLSLQHD